MISTKKEKSAKFQKLLGRPPSQTHSCALVQPSSEYAFLVFHVLFGALGGCKVGGNLVH
jgi:hypothetical protein